MRTRLVLALAVVASGLLAIYARSPIAQAADTSAKAGKAAIGETAPDFTLKDTYGKEFKLSEFKGKIVVLEWLSPTCPVSRGHHEKKTTQDAYKKIAEEAVWLGVHTTDSTKPETDRVYAAQMQLAYPVLIDTDGKVGHAFGARTTPHMFVIDKDGKLAYDGAIDDRGDTNYVVDAVEALAHGKKVAKAKTEPYGCGVKYPRK